MRDYPLPGLSRLESAFSKLEIDIIHTFSPFQVGLFAKRLSRTYRTPLVLTCQSMMFHYLGHIPIAKLLIKVHPMRRLLERLLGNYLKSYCDGCDCVVVPTLPTANWLRSCGVSRTRIEIIPMGFDMRLFEADNSLDVRDVYRIPPDHTLLVTVSRLSIEKNLEFLIQATAPVLRENTASLLIVGDGPERSKLESLCRKLGILHRVIFVGQVIYEKVPAILRASDIFVFSSLSESQGFAVWEALITGCPVVAVDAPGPADVITSGQEGYLTDASVDEFAQAITSLVKEPDRRRKMSRNAKVKGSQFRVEFYVDRLVKLYRSLTPTIAEH